MKIPRIWLISLLALAMFVLIAVAIFGNWYAPALGDAGLRLQHYLFQPLFGLGGLPITFFFLLRAAIFLLAMVLVSHFTMLLRRKAFRKESIEIPFPQRDLHIRSISDSLSGDSASRPLSRGPIDMKSESTNDA